ncbi:hypothetical protein OIO90_000364 [Microbotryomycetes sp. JL221]|nr:hypothetical protein OIO90_000364 [Microbotryomycetes sp. JL221]
MPLCTRKGCGKEFDPAQNSDAACTFHPGAPVFHEGLKSYSCCSDKSGHRPVTDFSDFLNIPGCATGSHSSEKPVEPVTTFNKVNGKDAANATAANVKPVSSDANGREVYGTAATPAAAATGAGPAPLPQPPAGVKLADAAKPQSTQFVIEQDDPDVPVAKGMACKRKSCNVTYDGQERTDEECEFHAGVPIFHEGSKGWSCCKRRVLDFDDFLKIQGCRKNRHLFVGPKKDDTEEELVDCRTDHYQTPRQVIVSCFGKNADKEKSVVKFDTEAMHVDLILPGRKRYTKTFSLYGPIRPDESSYRILGTKVEITLAKADARSWPTITALDSSLSRNFVAQLTFSAGGGRGTVGGKEAILDEQNRLRQ